ncbi:tetratricopeptide repeat protein [Halarsenatibacter silvermanii]|uniref:Tetratricopeptide repeat-containing protein n=1 Tax=Halarsenatibacter silvermanii TaxID=321763 RepID=A0A1G9Q4B4_9FIRM|nr:tetratricopeptide repeat protein [Halarsenatibacter silvermanii]SDM05878.1 Tetratricopeptide repeat-containing protein [Halarsenatibacter silvermanii]
MRKEEHIDKTSEEIAKDYRRAEEMIKRGKTSKAEQILDKILAEDEKFVPALNKLAVIQIRAGRTDEGENLLERALNQDPDYPPALSNLGNLAKEAGELDRAEKLYRQALEINPEYGPAYNNLGVIKREGGEYKDSIKFLKKAQKRGTFSLKTDSRPFYRDPGCLLPMILAGLIGIVVIIWIV